ncbi:MAG TPA: GNAT family protein [Actinospica sp.]|nr:GNAT family protein [Actinospica sp.]
MRDLPVITMGDAVLRAWRQDDAEAAAAAWADPEIRRWGRYGAMVPDRGTVGRWLDWNREQWEYGLRAGFAICRAEEDGGELMGSIMVRDFARTASAIGETGYWIVERWRGRGVATRALDALSRWALAARDEGGLGVGRIELRHSVRNAGSCRVALKAGYRHEATMRESYRYADGFWHDEHLHARLPGDI